MATEKEQKQIEHRKRCFACALYDFTQNWKKNYPSDATEEERKEDTSNTLIFQIMCAHAITYAIEDLNKTAPGLKHYECELRDAILLGGMVDILTQIVRHDREADRAIHIFNDLIGRFTGGERKKH